PVLAHFDPSLDLELRVDACDIGVGAILGQNSPAGFRVLSYSSRLFSDAEKKLCTNDKECIALGFGLEKNRSVVYGHKVIAKTDNCGVCYLNKKVHLTPKMARIALLLQQYDLEILHKKGRHNKDSDCLSRFPVGAPSNLGDNIEDYLLLITADEIENLDIRKMQSEDTFIAGIKALLELNHEYTVKELHDLSKFTVIDNVLFRRSDDRNPRLLLCIPEQLCEDVMYACHDDTAGAHLGYRKTLKKFEQRYFAPNIRIHLKNYVESCVECQTKKSVPLQKAGLLSP
ncbi:hypothetical protein B4U80_12424, partial [Leptotrombidium deliense]